MQALDKRVHSHMWWLVADSTPYILTKPGIYGIIVLNLIVANSPKR
jgi:hypothetical protein